MKNITTALFVFLSLTILCQEPVNGILNSNNIEASISSEGRLFNSQQSEGFFLVPNNEEQTSISTIFAGNLWIAASDDLGNIYGAAASYGIDDSYTYGMLQSNTAVPFIDPLLRQNRVWNITKPSIEKIQNGDFENIDKDILEWPAKGNSFYDDLLSERDGAPFFDADTDGIYNPLNGDFPVVGEDFNGVVPDQILLSVTNDRAESANFDGLGVEIYTMIYGFSCPDFIGLNNSVFQRQIIYNRSSLNYSSLKFGHFFDFDLGCSFDDFVGCDTLSNVFYTYNADEVDGDAGSFCTNSSATFEDSPVHIVKVLNGTLNSFISYERETINSGTTNPPAAVNTELDVYNMCNGAWTNGVVQTIGGNGYNPGSIDTTKFAFHGNPNDPFSWSMVNNVGQDYDAVVVAGQHFESLASGERMMLDLVHTYVQSNDDDHLETVNLAIQNSNIVEEEFNNKFSNLCEISSTIELANFNITLSPNPASGFVRIEGETHIESFRLLDLNGREVLMGNISNDHMISLDQVSGGLYVLELSSPNIGIQCERLVITE